MGCLNVKVKRAGEVLKVNCGLVCSINKARHLSVTPKQIFLMPGNQFTDDVLVKANVVWNVK